MTTFLVRAAHSLVKISLFEILYKLQGRHKKSGSVELADIQLLLSLTGS